MGKTNFGTNHHDVDIVLCRCQDVKILNNALQHWNHTFFWNCITPFKSSPEGELRKLI